MSDFNTNRNRYQRLISGIFLEKRSPDATEVFFTRDDLVIQAKKLDLTLPKNLGDVIYTFRSRQPMPEEIVKAQPIGFEWVIEGVGTSKYVFRLVSESRITPNANLLVTEIPEATPDIVRKYSLSDEQALLAIVRYNRLLDIFLGIVTYSLQNHLRTNVSGIGQIEIDELYVGLDKKGSIFVIPVQAKVGKDQIGIVQTKQDIAFCAVRYPNLVCRAIAAQFMSDDVIALFELTVVEGKVCIVDERHYKLTKDS